MSPARLALAAAFLVLGACSCAAAFDFQVKQMHAGPIRLEVGFAGSGPVKVVMLHGFPESMNVWEPVVEAMFNKSAFSESLFKIVAPNQRGYGGSDQPEEVEAYNVNQLVEDIHELVKQVTASPEEKVLLVAHDFGGLVGWVFAHRYGHRLHGFVVMNCPHPTIFESLINFNDEQRTAAKYLRIFANHQTTTYWMLSAFGYAALRKSYDGSLSADLESKLVSVWERSLASSMKWYPANVYIPSSFSFDGTELIGFPDAVTVDVPTLFIWGMKDPMYIHENLNGLEKFVPYLTVKTYALSAHFPNVDDPARVAEDVLEFALKVCPI